MWAHFITDIIDIFFPPHEDVLKVRKLDYEKFATYVHLSFNEPHSTYTSLPYSEDAVRAVIRANKFYHDHHAAKLLGEVLGDMLIASREEYALIEHSAPWVLAAIPVSRARRDERGGNQVEWIINEVPKNIQNSFTYTPHLLERIHRESQTHLSKKERIQNMAGVFSVSDTTLIKGTTVVLVDDVIETGATMKDAMRALHEAGAKKVIGVVLAK